jgi:hypothetical protein
LQVGSDDPDVAIEQRLKDGVLIDGYDLVVADHLYFAKFEIEARRSAATSALLKEERGWRAEARHHTRPEPTG